MSIPDHARANFETLVYAATRGDLALIECTEIATGEVRYVICAVGRDDGDYVSPIHQSVYSEINTTSVWDENCKFSLPVWMAGLEQRQRWRRM